MLLWCHAVAGLVFLEIVSLTDPKQLDGNQTLTLTEKRRNIKKTSKLIISNETKIMPDTTETAKSDLIDRASSETKNMSNVVNSNIESISMDLLKTAGETTQTNATTNGINISHYTPTTELITMVGLKGSLIYRFLMKEHVVTCDGYILDIFRLRTKKEEPTRKYPVLLFHGMMQSSDRFVASKNQSIAFILEDLGFDVWLGNSRGNKYSRLHINLEPDEFNGEKMKYFEYSYEEIGLYDVGATVDFILRETGAEKLHYIGVSQGGTAFLALNSLQPHYNDKFESAHLLAPLGYQKHYSNSTIQTLAKMSDIIHRALLRANIFEIYPNRTTPAVPHTPQTGCLGKEKFDSVCVDLDIAEIMGLNETNFETFDTLGGSIQQLVHYGQNMRDKAFRRFDYGTEKNRERYSDDKPPVYDLSLVRAKTVMYYSLSDVYVAAEDVIDMARDMPNARAEQVARKSFTHLDFVKGKDLISCVYGDIIFDMGAGKEFKTYYVEPDDHEPDSSTKLSLSLMLYALPLFILKLT